MKTLIKYIVPLAAFLGACATSQSSPEKLSSLRGSLRAAQEMGAEQNPQAALYLQYAREAADAAKAHFDAGHNEQGASWLDRSEADAQVALAILRAAKAQAVLDDTAAQTSN